MIALAFLRDHWRALLALLALLAACFGSFIAGRRSVACEQPAAIASAEKLYSEDTSVTTKATDAQHVRTVTVRRDRITTRPDGTVTQEHTERNAGTESRLQIAEKTQAVRVETREVEKRVEVPAKLPSWRVGALVGVDVTRPPLLSDGRVGVGVLVERRIAGPLSAGLWGVHTGAAGVVVSLEF